jgi:hypothetical protein
MKLLTATIPGYENDVTIYYDTTTEPSDQDYPGSWDCEIYKVVDDETFEDISGQLNTDQFNFVLEYVFDYD